MADGYIQEEGPQICVGELLENMVDTVSKTKSLYCDVWIPAYFTKDSSHPLTYVPLWCMGLPLMKGDKVLVAFKDGDFSLPYLWKNPNEIDEGFYKKFEFPQGVQGGVTTQPASKDTVSAQKLGKDAFVIKTNDYTAIRQNDAFVVMSADGKIYAQGSQVDVASTGKVNVDSAGELNVKAGQNTLKMDSGGVTINNHLKVLP